MSVRSFAAQLRAEIENLKQNGTAAIYCDNLIEYLKQVESNPEPNPTEHDLESYRAELQQYVEQYRYINESNLEMFRSVIVAGQGAIKSAFLLNGGAAVAMLAFIGHLAQFSPERVPAFAVGLLWFTHGVLAIAVTSGLTYLSQWFYGSDFKFGTKIGFFLNIVCIILGIFSYFLFLKGTYSMYNVFSTFP